MAELSELLQYLVKFGGSDLHLKAGSPPYIRLHGVLTPTELPVVRPADTQELATAMIPKDRVDDFVSRGEVGFAIGVSGLGRFRASVLRQRGSIAIVLRRVLTEAPSFEALGFPQSVAQLVDRRKGLILVTGPADSGKSTTAASLINQINETQTMGVVTIEDPIEILHSDKQSFVSQREVGGIDTKDHSTGLGAALGHYQDVIYVDRIPNPDVMEMVLSASHSRLVISTLPSLDAAETIRRVLDFFPTHMAKHVRHEFAGVIEGIICQQLVSREDGKGRLAAFELMIKTPRIHDAITEEPGSQPLETLISTGEYHGMQTMDQHLASLYKKNLINKREALSFAIHPQDLRVHLE